MTTPNSLSGNGTVTVTPQPTLSYGEQLAASFDVQDNPAPIQLPFQAKPAATPATPPAGTTVAPETPAPSVPPVQPAQQPSQQPAPPIAGQPTPADIKHPAWLIDAAVNRLGMHTLIIERLTTPELTQLVVSELARSGQSAPQTQASQVQNASGKTDAQAAANVAAQTPPNAPQEPAWDWGEHQAFDDMGNPLAGKKMKYTDDMINPAIGHWIKKLAAEVKEVRDFQNRMKQKVAENQHRTIEDQFDQAFSLFPAVFGKGNVHEIKSNPEFFQRRQLIFGAVRGMFRSMDPAVAAKMTVEQAVKVMAKSLLGVEPPAPAPAAAANGNASQLPANHPGQNFANANVAVPTQRQPSQLPLGDARAAAAVQAWWDENRNAGLPADGATTMEEFFG